MVSGDSFKAILAYATVVLKIPERNLAHILETEKYESG